MKRLLLAAGVIGAMMLTASPADAQRYRHRGHTSFSISIGGGYAPYGYGYGYAPYDYGYAYPASYDYYPYYPPVRYYSTYYRDSWRRHHRHDRRYYRYNRY